MSVQDIRNLKKLSQEMPSSTSKINATIDASNAIVSGRIQNVEATGALLTNSARKKGTNPRLTNSPLKSILDHRDSGVGALRLSERAKYPKRKPQPRTENEMALPLEIENIKGINVTAVGGTGNFIEVDWCKSYSNDPNFTCQTLAGTMELKDQK
jgi:hypothetical protein